MQAPSSGRHLLLLPLLGSLCFPPFSLLPHLALLPNFPR
eukprot:COSAG06_NODE_41407_length_391_cov_39.273973_1_plen_38_part_10